ncbi:hypothetical protein L9F63_022618, partial [Diploptera punctata]
MELYESGDRSIYHGCHRHASPRCNPRTKVTYLFLFTVIILLLGHLGVCTGRPDVISFSSSSTTSRSTSSPSGNNFLSRPFSWSVIRADRHYNADIIDDDDGVGGGVGDNYDNGGYTDENSSPSSSIGRSPDTGGLDDSSGGRVTSTNSRQTMDDGKGGDGSQVQTVEHGETKRYSVASVEFKRVETPFIIGVWIFSASLAKI